MCLPGWVCVIGAGCCGRYTPNLPRPSPPSSSLSCIKQIGGKGTFVTLLSLTETITPLTGQHKFLRGRTEYPETREGTQVCWISSSWVDGLRHRRLKWRKKNINAKNIIIISPFQRLQDCSRFGRIIPTLAPEETHRTPPSHEDLQPDLPAAAARGSPGTELLCQTR